MSGFKIVPQRFHRNGSTGTTATTIEWFVLDAKNKLIVKHMGQTILPKLQEFLFREKKLLLLNNVDSVLIRPD